MLIPAGAYYRMSTDEQAESIPGQRAALQPWAKEGGFRIVKEYADEGISGDATEKRKEFQRMIADAVSGAFKAILCWDQDRFGRFDSLEAGYWIHPLRKAGIRLVTMNEGPINWDDFTGRMMYSMKQEGKHQYLRDLSRNVMRGMLQKAQAGLWPGGPAPLGYTVATDGKLQLGQPHAVAAVRFLFDGYLAGHSLRTLTEEMNAKGYQTARGRPFHYIAVRFILKNRNYTGDMLWNVRSESKYNAIQNGRIEAAPRGGSGFNAARDWIVIENAHPAIVSRAEFEAVQVRLRERRGVKSSPGASGGRYVMSGLVRCGKCGSPMSGNTYAGHPFYVCCGYFHRGASFCDRNAVRQDELVTTVVGAIERTFLGPDAMRELREQIRSRAVKSLSRSSLAGLESMLAMVRKDLETASRNMALASTEFLRRQCENYVLELAERERTLLESLAAARSPRERVLADAEARVDQATNLLAELRQTLDAADTMRLREVLRLAVERVEVRTRFEQKPKRKKFFLEGGTIAMKCANLFGAVRGAKRIIEFGRAG